MSARNTPRTASRKPQQTHQISGQQSDYTTPMTNGHVSGCCNNCTCPAANPRVRNIYEALQKADPALRELGNMAIVFFAACWTIPLVLLGREELNIEYKNVDSLTPRELWSMAIAVLVAVLDVAAILGHIRICSSRYSKLREHDKDTTFQLMFPVATILVVFEVLGTYLSLKLLLLALVQLLEDLPGQIGPTLVAVAYLQNRIRYLLYLCTPDLQTEPTFFEKIWRWDQDHPPECMRAPQTTQATQ